MTKLYKLTTQDGRTRVGFNNETQWGEAVTHSGTGDGDLCGPGYIHAYEHPLVAVLMNPIHANIQNPVLWEGDGEIALRDGPLKCGCVTFTTLRRIPLPTLSTENRVEAAIRCALHVYRESGFVTWAQAWLSGADRTAAAATAAARAARAARAAVAAVAAAEAAWAAEAAAAAEAARAAEAAWAAAWAARTAAVAAAGAAERAADLPLISILEAVRGRGPK